MKKKLNLDNRGCGGQHQKVTKGLVRKSNNKAGDMLMIQVG